MRLGQFIGGLLWMIGFLLIMAGSVIRGPALGMGMTIEKIRWEGATLKFEFNGQGYQKDLPTADKTAPRIEITPIYTKAKADWDSILLEGQTLKVVAADGRVVYQTNTTQLRLQRPLIGDFTLGQAAEWMLRLGVMGSIGGPLLIFWHGRGIAQLIWIMVVIVYLL